VDPVAPVAPVDPVAPVAPTKLIRFDKFPPSPQYAVAETFPVTLNVFEIPVLPRMYKVSKFAGSVTVNAYPGELVV
jgi:hypothetical protein